MPTGLSTCVAATSPSSSRSWLGCVPRFRVYGRDLALKIRYPGVARSITSDVDNVAVLLRLLNLLPLYLDVDAIAGEAARELLENRLQTAKVRGSSVS